MANHQGKAVHWRRDPTVLARLPQVERLHLRRVPNTTIAAQLGVAEVTIRRDIERLNELWRERISGEQATMRAQIVAELDDTRERALAQAEWDEACERAVLFGEAHPTLGRIRTDDKGSAQFRGAKAQSTNVARQATMDKAKVLGLVVDKAEVTGEAPVRVVIREQAQS